MSRPAALRIDPADNVAVALRDIDAGETLDVAGTRITAAEAIGRGHKLALRRIAEGAHVLRYGNVIGVATTDIAPGRHVHSHTMRSDMAVHGSYRYAGAPVHNEPTDGDDALSFMGFRRPDGSVGVRNDIWIIPTVGCVNEIAMDLAGRFADDLPDGIDAIRALTHPLGCSQLGGDHERTRRLLAALARHPNAGGVLLLGLGCENNRLGELRDEIGDTDPRRIAMLNCQDCEDEDAEAADLLEQLGRYAAGFRRERCGIDELVIGLKCGGSDGLSGITANPLAGRVCDRVTAAGGSALLSETPEMFGAEHLLMARCADESTFQRCAAMIEAFKNYYAERGMPVDENPSPGNMAGGITTLAEKSLGCVTKAGSAVVVDVLDYAAARRKRGLSLLDGPGNDIVATTNLIAAGAQIVLFTTGRGTPLSGPAPTLKIASNSDLAARKRRWIDFNAGSLLDGVSMEKLSDDLLARVLDTASGEQFTAAEKAGRSSIAIFHDGVTL